MTVLASEIPEGYLIAAFVAATGLLFSVLGWLCVQSFTQNRDVGEIKTTISAELRHNGGGSIKDAIHDLQSGQVMVCRQVEEVREAADRYRAETKEEILAAEGRLADEALRQFRTKAEALPYIERLERVEEGHGEILTRLDGLSAQLGLETSRVIGAMDVIEVPARPVDGS